MAAFLLCDYDFGLIRLDRTVACGGDRCGSPWIRSYFLALESQISMDSGCLVQFGHNFSARLGGGARNKGGGNVDDPALVKHGFL